MGVRHKSVNVGLEKARSHQIGEPKKTETELEAESTEVPMARDLFKRKPRARNLLKLKLDCLVEENATAGLIRRDGNISRTLR